MKFVITAGPTREPLDPVRYLSNRSSGKMGYALAAAALEAGHEVILISGPVALPPPFGAKTVAVTTGAEMLAAAEECFAECDVFIMCAAVCDYRPVERSAQKLPKQRGPFSLTLEPTDDILRSLTSRPHRAFVVGFAAETEDLPAKARRKLETKKCDLLIANDVSQSEIGMEADENEVVLFFPNDDVKTLPRAKKTELARALLKIILITKENCLTKKT